MTITEIYNISPYNIIKIKMTESKRSSQNVPFDQTGLKKNQSSLVRTDSMLESISEEKIDINVEIAAEIMEDYDKNRALIEEYRESRTVKVPASPVLANVEKILFTIIRPAMIEILRRIHQENSFYKPKTSFNGIDYFSEYCYNMNPKYPERKKKWSYIFDMDWVKRYLEEHPRPYYPISLLMSRNTAAKYIQAHLRGYWVRRRPDLQEIRQFWKTVKLHKDSSGKLSVSTLTRRDTNEPF